MKSKEERRMCVQNDRWWAELRQLMYNQVKFLHCITRQRQQQKFTTKSRNDASRLPTISSGICLVFPFLSLSLCFNIPFLYSIKTDHNSTFLRSCNSTIMFSSGALVEVNELTELRNDWQVAGKNARHFSMCVYLDQRPSWRNWVMIRIAFSILSALQSRK